MLSFLTLVPAAGRVDQGSNRGVASSAGVTYRASGSELRANPERYRSVTDRVRQA